MATKLPEAGVASYWLAKAAGLTGLITEEDGPVAVIHPGYLNTSHGPDIRDALVATNHGLQAGDIEIHTDSSGWWRHRHHLDPAYNRVVLHVVHRHDAGRPAVLANGRSTPTLCLEGLPGESEFVSLPSSRPETGILLPCYNAGQRVSPEKLGLILDAAGRERFLAKAAVFRAELKITAPSEVLYTGIMEALGYSRNRTPMRRLAQALPLRTLEEIAGPSVNNEERSVLLQAALLGTAGLLPSQRTRRSPGTSQPLAVKLENSFEATGLLPVLKEYDWMFARVRPGNYPVRRIAAMSELLAVHRAGGLLEDMLAAAEDFFQTGSRRELIEPFIVPAAGFWRENLDFGRPLTGAAPALCGPDRAAIIAINVALPLAYACRFAGTGKEEPALARYAEARISEDNGLISLMKERLGLERSFTSGTIRQQGLLHFYLERCRYGKCRGCPLGEP